MILWVKSLVMPRALTIASKLSRILSGTSLTKANKALDSALPIWKALATPLADSQSCPLFKFNQNKKCNLATYLSAWSGSNDKRIIKRILELVLCIAMSSFLEDADLAKQIEAMGCSPSGCIGQRHPWQSDPTTRTIGHRHSSYKNMSRSICRSSIGIGPLFAMT